MKKFIGIIALVLSAQTLTIGQTTTKDMREDKKPSKDFFMLHLSYDGWNQAETDITTKFNRGIGAYINYDFPLAGKEDNKFSFAIGIGVSSSNIYFDKMIPTLKTSSESLSFVEKDSTTKNYKLNTAYLEAPLELRFYSNPFNRNKGFKIAIGAKIGYNVSTALKYKSEVQLTGTDTRYLMTEKEKSMRFTNQWKFAPTFRIGYGNFSVFGSYNVTTLFKEGRGPEITPFQIGLCISGL